MAKTVLQSIGRYHFLKVAAFLCLFYLCPLVYAHAQEPQYDYVTTLKLNGIELSHEKSFFSYDRMQAVFGKDGVITRAESNECTANFDLSVNYPKKNIAVGLEYFPEENPDFDKTEKFSLKNPNKAFLPAKGRLSADWRNMRSFSQKLQVGSLTVSPDLTFSTFKKHFPTSAKSPAYFGNDKTYIVYFISPPELKKQKNKPQFDDPAYNRHVKFGFRNGKLDELSIFQGIAC